MSLAWFFPKKKLELFRNIRLTASTNAQVKLVQLLLVHNGEYLYVTLYTQIMRM